MIHHLMKDCPALRVHSRKVPDMCLSDNLASRSNILPNPH